MRKKTRSIRQSTSPLTDGSSSPPPTPPASPSTKLYVTLDLALDKFIRCLCDGDLSVLLIEGEADRFLLMAAWEAIYELFLDAMKDREGLYQVRLNAKINVLEFNYKFIQVCIDRLKIGYSKNAEDCLRQMIRVDDQLNPENQDQYFRILQTVKNRAQRLQVELGEKKAEKAILESKPAGQTVQPGRAHFDSLIGQVSRFMKFYINRREVSAGEFVGFYVQMREESEAIQKLNSRR